MQRKIWIELPTDAPKSADEGRAICRDVNAFIARAFAEAPHDAKPFFWHDAAGWFAVTVGGHGYKTCERRAPGAWFAIPAELTVDDHN